MKTKTTKTSQPKYDADLFCSIKPDTIEDLIASRPVMTDDGESWYIEHLWIYLRDGKVAYSICDECGNHEVADQEDADSFMNPESEPWDEYNRWCAENGKDPLGNFMVPEETTIKETWTAILRVSILAGKYGLVIVSARQKGKRSIAPDKLPTHVAEFLEAEEHAGRYFCGGVHSFDDIQNATVKPRPNWATDRLVTFEVERKTPRSQRAIAADIRKKAAA